jgi:2-polyprenyl-3-methyl-5-hydroxy-6-metoxy-1,4-benzoquinol methylase
MGVADGMSVIDLGGSPMTWKTVPFSLNLTVLNLPGGVPRDNAIRHKITYIEGDACDVKEFGDRSFDMVFSNSVIEHVGAVDKRASFAKEVRRLGRSYWVQTPAIWFPLEPHCGMPFWWFYPEFVKRYFIERWRKKLPAWTTMVEETTILLKSELRQLFPEATILTEKFLGIPKSYIVHFSARTNQN